MNIGITGHNESHFENIELTKKNIYKNLDILISELKNEDLIFNIGGAHGVDLWVAEWCIAKNIPYNLYLPFINTDRQIKDWTHQQQKQFISVYNHRNCYNIYFGSNTGMECGIDCFEGEGYHSRNRAIVDNSDIIYAGYDYNIGKSGTLYTISYALKNNKPVINILNKREQIN